MSLDPGLREDDGVNLDLSLCWDNEGFAAENYVIPCLHGDPVQMHNH